MSDTSHFKMPLLDAAQAQKHVTINEAIVRADALSAGSVISRTLSAPPAANDGDVYIVGASASGLWTSHEDDLALFLNGGWEFVTPWAGHSVWISDEGTHAVFDEGWTVGQSAGSPGGAVTLLRVAEEDHPLAAAATSTTSAIIPDKAIVLGVTGRVIQGITGATSWSLGVAGSPDRYGSGYGPDLAAFARGVSGQPLAYYGGTELLITADGGNFTAGEIRLAVHYLDLSPPRVV